MKNTSHYTLLSSPRLVHRLAWKPLLFGVIVGVFISKIVIFESETNADSIIYQGIGKRHEYMNNNLSNNVTLQCLVLIQSWTLKPHKFVEAIRDTYAKKCDETLYFTSDKQLEEQFAGELNIYHLSFDLDGRKYSILHEILHFVSTKNKIENAWTVVVNEQNYVIVENMKYFLSQLANDKPVIAGKLVKISSFFDFIFPTETESFHLDAGIALSAAGVRAIIQNKECYPYRWGMPSYGGKSLFKCAVKNHFEIWDPVDEENKRLFLGKSPRNLFAQSNYAVSGMSFEESQRQSDCCSDRAVIFGLVNYRDQRVLDYALQNVRVFGL